jgi:hypothetical protein
MSALLGVTHQAVDQREAFGCSLKELQTWPQVDALGGAEAQWSSARSWSRANNRTNHLAMKIRVGLAFTSYTLTFME